MRRTIPPPLRRQRFWQKQTSADWRTKVFSPSTYSSAATGAGPHDIGRDALSLRASRSLHNVEQAMADVFDDTLFSVRRGTPFAPFYGAWKTAIAGGTDPQSEGTLGPPATPHALDSRRAAQIAFAHRGSARRDGFHALRDTGSIDG